MGFPDPENVNDVVNKQTNNHTHCQANLLGEMQYVEEYLDGNDLDDRTAD